MGSSWIDFVTEAIYCYQDWPLEGDATKGFISIVKLNLASLLYLQIDFFEFNVCFY